MKAIRIHEFGGPEVLKLEEIPRPQPADDEILLKVYASGVNPVDWAVRSGVNGRMRSILNLPLTLGWDAAGVVEAVGNQVTGLKKGDSVYGIPNFPGDGSYAEFCVAKGSQFATKPLSISFSEAAGVPLAALTAWTGISEFSKLQYGQRVLIHGASGGVGSFAVQFAKVRGAFVIGVASTANLTYLRAIGADQVIDYKTEKFEDLAREVDVVFDAAPLRDNQERLRSVEVLKQGGIFVSPNVDFPFSIEVLEALAAKNAHGELYPAQFRRDWLQEIALLIDQGKVKVETHRIYPLTQVAEAHKLSQTWHVRGKLVLEIVKSD